MKQRPRRYITDSEMALIWDRWERGDCIHAIARGPGRYHCVVQGAMARTGRIRPAPRVTFSSSPLSVSRQSLVLAFSSFAASSFAFLITRLSLVAESISPIISEVLSLSSAAYLPHLFEDGQYSRDRVVVKVIISQWQQP